MIRSMGYRQALPYTALRQVGGGSALAFETDAWAHFTAYVARVERLPHEQARDPAHVCVALDKVRREVHRFGSPALLRRLLAEEPDALAAAAPPPMLYGAIVWWMKRLQRSCSAAETTLTDLLTAETGSSEMKDGLRFMGSLAAHARSQIAPLMAALNGFKVGIIGANTELSLACKGAAAVLQQMQEHVGALQVRIIALESQIAGLSIFSGHRRHELGERLHMLRVELASQVARADGLRSRLGTLDPIFDDAVWLEPGLGDMIDFLDQSRAAWTSFGSGVSQLAADASESQLADTAWMKQALDHVGAIGRWDALSRAAGDFAVKALEEFPGRARRRAIPL